MVVKSIEVKNFQSHKNSVVHLDKGVNTFIGRSDYGKSAVMKSFLLVKDNKPDGTNFVSNWLVDEKGKIKDNTEVTVTFEDGTTVTRLKGKDNKYLVNGSELTAFGRGGVPDEVESLFNLADLNIQTQENNFFLFNMSSGEVMRRINTYVDLDLIDSSLSNADKAFRENRRLLSVAEAKKEDVDKRLTEYEMLPTLDKMYDACVKTEFLIENTKSMVKIILDYARRAYDVNLKLNQKEFVDLTKIQRKMGHTYETVKDIEYHKNRITIFEKLIDSCKRIEQSLPQDMKDIEFKIRQLQKLVDETKSVRTKVNRLQSVVVSYGKVKDSIIETPSIDKAWNRLQDVYSVDDKIDSIEMKINAYLTSQEMYKNVVNEIKRLEKEFNDKMPAVCPLCGSKTHTKHKEVIDEFEPVRVAKERLQL